MNVSVSTHPYDLVFVGSGASGSYTLLELLQRLEASPPATPLRLAVVERAVDQFGGLPYGSRSGFTSLIITSLRDFLPEPERTTFADWLTANKDTAFDEFLAEGGELTKAWWERHADEIAEGRWEALFLPRYLFGAYLRDRLDAAIARAGELGLATVALLHDEILDIVPAESGYLLRGRHGELQAQQVALTLGTPPTLSRLAGAKAASDDSVCLIDDPFHPSIQANVADIVRMASEPQDGAPMRICIVGGNASTMELIYQFADHAVGRLADATITVLTLRGSLPERLVPAADPVTFVPSSLEALRGTTDLTGRGLFEAAVADIERARSEGLTVSDTLGPMAPLLGDLVRSLSADEAAEWAGHWGMQLGRFQRRAGEEYCDIVDQLTAVDRLHLVEGAFTDAVTTEGGVTVSYDDASGSSRVLPHPFDVVINCSGFATLPAVTAGSLLANLFASGLITTTRWDRGIAVDDDLSAAPGVYVMGPLLAGNVITSGAIWHMEHCGRIIAYSATLADTLAARLTR